MSKGKKPKKGPKIEAGSRDARRLGALILEVLAGQRVPAEAAAEAGVSLPRYYQLEARALEGLIKACEPRARGRRVSPEREVARLEAEIERLERANARGQALLRLSQRAVGISASKAVKKAKGKRKRKPVARALKAAARLRDETLDLPEEGDADETR